MASAGFVRPLACGFMVSGDVHETGSLPGYQFPDDYVAEAGWGFPASVPSRCSCGGVVRREQKRTRMCSVRRNAVKVMEFQAVSITALAALTWGSTIQADRTLC